MSEEKGLRLSEEDRKLIVEAVLKEVRPMLEVMQERQMAGIRAIYNQVRYPFESSLRSPWYG